MILTPITINLKERLLMLRSTGEIWPVGPNDVQYVMPKSLVPAELADKAWHPDLLKLWSQGEDIGLSPTQEESLIGPERAAELLASRRKIASLLRRVLRESERMQGRLLSGSLQSGRGGGMDALWEGLAPSDPQQRAVVTAAEAAEYLLNKDDAGAEGTAKRITVKPGTLPAYAAHMLLMERPDLFLSSDLNMYETGTFMVRSRADKARHDKVAHLVQTQDPEFLAFVDKANRVREAIKSGSTESLPEWNETERDIVYQLSLALLERRGTQAPHTLSLACSIAKWFEPESEEVIDLAAIGPLLNELGVLPVYDSTMTSKLVESAERAAVMGRFNAPPVTSAPSGWSEPVAADAALDSLRVDHSHRVYVIDDPNARELDDGIALERISDDEFWVHTYVADPTRFIERDGVLSKTASFVGTAHYLDEGVVPMLPPSLGEGKLSLGARGSDRGQPVMIFSARMDRAGTVHDWKVGMGFTKNTVVTTYDAVNSVLGLDAPKTTYPFGKLDEALLTAKSEPRHLDDLTPEHTDDLKTLLELSLALRAERFKTAGFEWTGPMGAVSVHNTPPPPVNLHDPSSVPSPRVLTPRTNDEIQYGYSVVPEPAPTTSGYMVSEFMVLANQIAAWFCAERGIGVAFRGSSRVLDTARTQPENSVDTLLSQRIPGTGFMDMTRAKMGSLFFPATQLATTPLVHWSMGLTEGRGYVWATSPLRRYDDMLAHWQIKGALAADAGVSGGEGVLSHEDVWPLLRRAYFGQQRGRTAQRTAHRYFTAGLLRQRSAGPRPKGYVFNEAEAVDLHGAMDAVVIGPSVASAGRFTCSIAIPELALASDVEFNTREQAERLAVGDRIKVALKRTLIWPIPATSFKLVSA